MKKVGHGREKKWGWEKGNKKRRRNRESIDLLGRHVTEFLYCMVAYEW